MKIQSKKLVGLLKDKEALVMEGRGISKEIEKLENDRRKIGLQIQKLKDKIIPMVNEVTAGKLGEFEEISTVNVNGDEVEINTVDVIEDFKKAYLEQKNKPAETPTE